MSPIPSIFFVSQVTHLMDFIDTPRLLIVFSCFIVLFSCFSSCITITQFLLFHFTLYFSFLSPVSQIKWYANVNVNVEDFAIADLSMLSSKVLVSAVWKQKSFQCSSKYAITREASKTTNPTTCDSHQKHTHIVVTDVTCK